MSCRYCGDMGEYEKHGRKGKYLFLKCTQCGYMTVHPIPSAVEYSKEFYDWRYNPEIGSDIYKAREQQYALDRNVLSMFIKEGKAFDYGCGNGEFLPKYFEKYGCDISPYAEKEACKNLTIMHPESLEDEFFDLIVMRGVIEHLRRPVYWIERLVQKLKHNGIFFIAATPNSDSPAMLLYGLDWKLVDPPHHLHYFNPRCLSMLFGQFGCSLQHIDFPYFGTPYASDADHDRFVSDIRAYWGLKGQKDCPPYPGSMMTLVFKKL